MSDSATKASRRRRFAKSSARKAIFAFRQPKTAARNVKRTALNTAHEIKMGILEAKRELEDNE